MRSQTLLWSLVVFFGASLAFGAINNATEGESTGVRIAFQVLALLVIVALITAFVRLRK